MGRCGSGYSAVMAVLAEGVQYGLSSHGISSENKSLVFVKLTDSSIKSIEEYLRNKVRLRNYPQKWRGGRFFNGFRLEN